MSVVPGDLNPLPEERCSVLQLAGGASDEAKQLRLPY